MLRTKGKDTAPAWLLGGCAALAASIPTAAQEPAAFELALVKLDGAKEVLGTSYPSLFG